MRREKHVTHSICMLGILVCGLIDFSSSLFIPWIGCYKAFGMESFKIPDSKITASSYKMYHEPHQARLHMQASASGDGAWCAGQNLHQGEWLQVHDSHHTI